jgi:hypothetical protein
MRGAPKGDGLEGVAVECNRSRQRERICHSGVDATCHSMPLGIYYPWTRRVGPRGITKGSNRDDQCTNKRRDLRADVLGRWRGNAGSANRLCAVRRDHGQETSEKTEG